MKQSIDDLTNEAIDIVMQNNALQERIVEPLKYKILRYVVFMSLFNIIILLLILLLVYRLVLAQPLLTATPLSA